MNENVKPLTHQLEGNRRAGTQPAHYFCYDRGTGKTGTTMLNLDTLIGAGARRILYVAPLSTLKNVEREAVRFAKLLRPQVLLGDRRKRAKMIAEPTDRNLDIVNFEALRILAPELSAVGYDVVVIDEATRIKDRDAQVTKVATVLGKKARWRRCLSGMPFTEGVEDAWSQFNFLVPGLMSPSFYAFQHRYCETKTEAIPIRDKVTKGVIYVLEPSAPAPSPALTTAPNPRAIAVMDGRRRIHYVKMLHGLPLQRFPNGRPLIKTREIQKITGAKNLDEFEQKIAPYVHRVAKEDCVDLPPKTYETLRVTMSDDQAKLYKRVEDEARTVLAERVVDHSTALSKMAKLRQVAAGFLYTEGETIETPCSKYGELVDLLKESLYGVQKAVVFTAFRAEPEMIRSAVTASTKIQVFTLPENPLDRQETIDRWSAYSRGPAIIVTNVASGGVGLNLQAANLAVFFSNDWKMEYRAQAEDRIHRIGSDIHDKITIVDIVTEGTIEEGILEALKNKKNVVDAFLESMRRHDAQDPGARS